MYRIVFLFDGNTKLVLTVDITQQTIDKLLEMIQGDAKLVLLDLPTKNCDKVIFDKSKLIAIQITYEAQNDSSRQ